MWVEVEVNAGYGDTILVIVVNNTPKAVSDSLLAVFGHILREADSEIEPLKTATNRKARSGLFLFRNALMARSLSALACFH